MSRFGTKFGTQFGTHLGTYYPARGTGAAAFSGVVDGLIAAGVTVLGAYSTSHLLYSGYETGPLFSLRRSSDSSTVDIGHGASTYRTDTAAMASHCGATNGLIPTLYDQSLNGNDITQGTAVSQPKIYDSVTGVNYQGTLPFAIFAAASLQRWARGDAMGMTGAPAITMCYFAKATGFGVRRYMMNLGPSGANSLYVGAESATGDPLMGVTGVARRNFTEATALTTQSMIVHRIAASTNVNASTCRQDGADLSESGVVAGTPNIANTGFSIGTDPAGGPPWDGSGCFWIVINANATGAALTALEDFGTTLRGLD